MAILNVLGVLALGLLYGLYNTHTSIHEKNSCGMTYMWRQISFYPLLTDSANTGYSLLRYFEGHVRELNPQPDDVPVLFIPGSAGSYQQVRSIASVMMNKTTQQRFPFKLQFFTVDFKEEHSILSGRILYQQREFLKEAIGFLQRMHSKCYYKKVILIGHSLGGVLAYSLPAHPKFDLSSLDLIITLAAPLGGAPVFTDNRIVEFYREMHTAWGVKRKELSNVGILSYSGGEKDFLVPDHLTNISRACSLPSWSIAAVNTPVDHLCILWCNQLVRHVTRSLSYYMEAKRQNERMPTSDIVRKIRKKELTIFPKSLHEDMASQRRNPLGLFDNGHIGLWKSGLKMTRAKEIMMIDLDTKLILTVNVYLNHSCAPDTLYYVVYPNGYQRTSFKSTNQTLRTWYWAQEGKTDYGISLLQGKENCEYNFFIIVDIFRTWYRISLMNLNTVACGVIYLNSLIVLVEALQTFKDLKTTVQHGIWACFTVLCGGVLALYSNLFIEQYVTFTSILAVFVVVRLVFRFPLWLIINLPTAILRAYQAILLSLACICATLNPYMASLCIGLTSVMVIKSSDGLNSVCLAGLCSIVNGAIGLSAVYRRQTIENIKQLPGIPNIDECVSRSLPVFLYIILKSRIGSRLSSILRVSFGPSLSKVAISTIIIGYGYNNWQFSPMTLDDAAFTGSLMLGVLNFLHSFN